MFQNIRRNHGIEGQVEKGQLRCRSHYRVHGRLRLLVELDIAAYKGIRIIFPQAVSRRSIS
jgi:hypothetical protein